MSRIDRSLDRDLRAELIAEVRGFLPAFLSAATVENQGPVVAAAELLGLHVRDLHRVLAVHALLSDPVQSFVRDIPDGVRHPIMGSLRPRVVSRVVTSGVDWAATVRGKATSNPTEPEWVMRPARRVFDLPENRALAWLLDEIHERTVSATSLLKHDQQRSELIQRMGTVTERARRVSWLASLPSEWPGDSVFERLQSDRLGFYRTRVAPAARYLRRLLYLPSIDDLVQAICDRYFEPTQDWKLYEIAVLLRISRALAEVGQRRGNVRTLNASASPFVSYEIGNDRLVNLWYQRWPNSSGDSELSDAIKYYGTGLGSSRPDVIIEIVDGDRATRLVILELKASYSEDYLSSGFAQLLGYLRDRPTLTGAPASGWLVVPHRDHTSLDPEERSLWLVSADNVASAVVDATRVRYSESLVDPSEGR